jgi:peptidoglycan/xylan/chitin deacetylase (PgdA/CDA1 family)
MEGRIVWKKDEVTNTSQSSPTHRRVEKISPVIPIPISTPIVPKRKIQVLLSIDFDAVSGFLGTGASSTNDMAAYSSGFFAGQVGVPRLLKLFKKHKISSQVTWFIPGHSMETFPTETKLILDSGAEIGCHGYAHEGAAQMSEEQEREMIARCVELNNKLTGKKPLGWRAPLYQLREHTVKVLEEYGFLYGKSIISILECNNVGILTYRTRYILNPPRFLTLFPPRRTTHQTNRFQSPPLSNHLDETTPSTLSPNLFHPR